MKSRAGLYSVLACVAMLAWALFILGCLQWTAWSPDSSKVLFPYMDPHGKHIGIALYDRRTQHVTPAFIESFREDDGVPLLPQWAASQKQIIVARAEESNLDVFVLGVIPGTPIWHIRAAGAPPLAPFPELDGVMYIPTGQTILRVNLASRTVLASDLERAQTKEASSQDESSVRLFRAKDEILYMRPRPGDKTQVEIGTVGISDLHLEPLFRFTTTDANGQVLEGGATHPDGMKFAFVDTNKETKTENILIFTRSGLEQTVSPRGLPSHSRLGNVQWSGDGKILYAAVLNPVGEKSIWQYSVAGISMNGQVNWVTPICKITDSDNEEDSLRFFAEISLSPDGTTIATTPALLDSASIAEEDRALFLLNVSGTRRKVTRIPAPISKQR